MNDNKLTKAQQERLIKLMEECSEAIHVICKILQWGYDDIHPIENTCNKEMLEKELGDLQFWVERLCSFNDLHVGTIEEYTKLKFKKAKIYTQYQPSSLGISS